MEIAALCRKQLQDKERMTCEFILWKVSGLSSHVILIGLSRFCSKYLERSTCSILGYGVDVFVENSHVGRILWFTIILNMQSVVLWEYMNDGYWHTKSVCSQADNSAWDRYPNVCLSLENAINDLSTLSRDVLFGSFPSWVCNGTG